MKNFKKWTSVLLALVMALALAVPAFAEEGDGSQTPETPAATTEQQIVGENVTDAGKETKNFTITLPDDGRTYKIYQIFTGDVDGDTLSNVLWGENGTGTKGETVDEQILKELSSVVSKPTDAERLAVIEKYVKMDENAPCFAEINKDTTDRTVTVPGGYYLIKDDGPVNTEAGESVGLNVVQVVGSFAITPKTGTIDFEKKVKDTNDSEANSTTDWQDSADYDIGDLVPFQLKATIPANYDKYTTYELVFHDKEDKGLTFQETTVEVYVDGEKIESGFDVRTKAGENLLQDADGNTDDCTFEIVFSNLKEIASVTAGSVITVEYKSQLNSDAEIGSKGNPNEAYLEFSNNPNSTGTGKTKTDTVIVFTYTLKANKVNQDNKPLAGAGFTLYKWDVTNGNWSKVTEIEAEDSKTEFEFKGLDDGLYKLEETTVPSGYNKMADVYFKIVAEHDSGLTKLTAYVTDEAGTVKTEIPEGEAEAVELTWTSTEESGAITTTVTNYAGTELPETGGIGTTIFYGVGGVLVVAAVVLLVTKKRMSTKD